VTPLSFPSRAQSAPPDQDGEVPKYGRCLGFEDRLQSLDRGPVGLSLYQRHTETLTPEPSRQVSEKLRRPVLPRTPAPGVYQDRAVGVIPERVAQQIFTPRARVGLDPDSRPPPSAIPRDSSGLRN
jgi:hypothetical protein